jgi:hypothetical protein
MVTAKYSIEDTHKKVKLVCSPDLERNKNARELKES